jgi:hypothetical protein
MTEKDTATRDAAPPPTLPDWAIAAAAVLAIHHGLIPEPDRKHLPVIGYCR